MTAEERREYGKVCALKSAAVRRTKRHVKSLRASGDPAQIQAAADIEYLFGWPNLADYGMRDDAKKRIAAGVTQFWHDKKVRDIQ
jgi:hypothetical protein